MNAVFKKMNFKDYEKLYVLNTPKEFKPNLEEMAEITTVKKSPNCKQQYEFILVFVKTKEDIIKYTPKITGKLIGDSVLWFAYPKKTSRNYKSDITRDDGWQPLGKLGFEPVRMIAIDDDWSALRFKNVEYIKTMKRGFAISEKGKERIEKNK
ncbi:MAG: hypothetical protein JEY94_08820 [Melioribacteraceae bacterium]|nr:hypothetical protein [Melioribacteraceae bacterium]